MSGRSQMNSVEGLIAVLLACLVMSNREASKLLFIVCGVYLLFLRWYVSLPLLILAAVVWGIVWLFKSGKAKDVSASIGFLGGLALVVVGLYKLLPTAFELAFDVVALGFYAFMIVAVIWIIVADPWKTQRR
jgi:hypothetical protein